MIHSMKYKQTGHVLNPDLDLDHFKRQKSFGKNKVNRLTIRLDRHNKAEEQEEEEDKIQSGVNDKRQGKSLEDMELTVKSMNK